MVRFCIYSKIAGKLLLDSFETNPPARGSRLECYRLYGLLDEDLTYKSNTFGIQLGERAFEIVMARKLAEGSSIQPGSNGMAVHQSLSCRNIGQTITKLW